MLRRYSSGRLFVIDKAVIRRRNFPSCYFAPLCFSLEHLGPIYCVNTSHGNKYLTKTGPSPFVSDGRVFRSVGDTIEEFNKYKKSILALNAYRSKDLPSPSDLEYDRFHSCGFN